MEELNGGCRATFVDVVLRGFRYILIFEYFKTPSTIGKSSKTFNTFQGTF